MKLGISEEGLKEDNKDLMPFGKWKGTPISELSVTYIIWLLTNCDFLDNWLVEKLNNILELHKDELPCYGKFYDESAKVCQKCRFAEECSEKSEEMYYSQEK